VEYGYDTDATAKQVAAGKGIGNVSDNLQKERCFLEFGRKIEKLALEWKVCFLTALSQLKEILSFKKMESLYGTFRLLYLAAF
jgi:hypothetical protein